MKFAAIDSARIAKKKLDNRSFYGKDLHVCYAPEFESVQDTREKLEQRRRVIAWKTRGKGRGSVFSPGCLRIVGHYPFQSESILATIINFVLNYQHQLAAMAKRPAASKQRNDPGGTDFTWMLVWR